MSSVSWFVFPLWKEAGSISAANRQLVMIESNPMLLQFLNREKSGRGGGRWAMGHFNAEFRVQNSEWGAEELRIKNDGQRAATPSGLADLCGREPRVVPGATLFPGTTLGYMPQSLWD